MNDQKVNEACTREGCGHFESDHVGGSHRRRCFCEYPDCDCPDFQWDEAQNLASQSGKVEKDITSVLAEIRERRASVGDCSVPCQVVHNAQEMAFQANVLSDIDTLLSIIDKLQSGNSALVSRLEENQSWWRDLQRRFKDSVFWRATFDARAAASEQTLAQDYSAVNSGDSSGSVESSCSHQPESSEPELNSGEQSADRCVKCGHLSHLGICGDTSDQPLVTKPDRPSSVSCGCEFPQVDGDNPSLLPCPFCGSHAHVRSVYATPSSPLQMHWAECVICEVGTKYHDSKQKATATWNTRTNSDGGKELCEVLEGMLKPPLVLEGDSAIDVAGWFTNETRKALALITQPTASSVVSKQEDQASES